ncbi:MULTISPECIES: prepilin-type N-terminal cleavage/methylation domain-containing protein [unclassified Ligilactobacillus]|uniref:prepilin-type N-terminal cleavage/methylation domain-containing protein n=1 Tax=unclassified Ligilactobacillus TaxID=2767920 RepID=UPI003851CBC1
MGRRSKPGFTLIETTIVLLIVTILAGMVTVGPGKRWQAAWQERWFFKRFNAIWIETVTNPRLLQTNKTVVFTKNQVRFIVDQHECHVIAVPASLHLLRYQVVKVAPSGSVTPVTVCYQSPSNRCNKVLVFQLGYGGQYKYEEIQR